MVKRPKAVIHGCPSFHASLAFAGGISIAGVVLCSRFFVKSLFNFNLAKKDEALNSKSSS